MNGFVPREKMSKKARRQRDLEKRRLWDCPPVTRVVESRKRYSRKRKERGREDAAFFMG